MMAIFTFARPNLKKKNNPKPNQPKKNYIIASSVWGYVFAPPPRLRSETYVQF